MEICMSSLLIHTLPSSYGKSNRVENKLNQIDFLIYRNKLKSRVTFLTKIHFNVMSGLIKIFLRDSAAVVRLEMEEKSLFALKPRLIL